MDYKTKYFKYKNKYHKLKEQRGGDIKTVLDNCKQKHLEKYAQDIIELIKNNKNAKRELSIKQEQDLKTDKDRFKIFNDRDEQIIFQKSLPKTDFTNNYEALYRPPQGLKQMNDAYSDNIIKSNLNIPSAKEVENYALIDYSKDEKKIIPNFGSYCYGPTVGIIELRDEQYINNWEKINIGDIVRIWGTLEKSGTIGHVVLEITTSDNMIISVGVGYFGSLDDVKFDKIESSRYGIIQLLSNVLNRKKAVLYSPDYIFNMKIYYNYNYPNRSYIKLLSQSIITKDEHSMLFTMFSKIKPSEDLAHITVNESEYDFTKRYNLSAEDYDILRDSYFMEFYNDKTYLSQLQQTSDKKTKQELEDLLKFKKLKEKNDLIENFNKILAERGAIIEKYWNKYILEDKITHLKPKYPYTKIYTYYLSYYWYLSDVDYCTLTGYISDKYSKTKGKKPVVNCTKFVTDLFPRIIDCKRTLTGIIDPESCIPILDQTKTTCDVEDVPNEFVNDLNKQ